MKNNFAVFILTNGRPKNVVTYETLKKHGYTGDIYLIVDNLDKTKDEYIEKFGKQVVVFNKKAIAKKFDTGDNFDDMRSIVFARNASFEIAEKLGLRYFVQLDDDYTTFRYNFNSNFEYDTKSIKKLDKVFESLLKFYIISGVSSLAMAQGGDFIGGSLNTSFAKNIRLRRKCMNSFFCSTERRFFFIGRINEDVNTYTHLASKGLLFLTANQVSLDQLQTQTNKGGMTEFYLDSGTYIKSFYTVIYMPSSVKISILNGNRSSRLHHRISWKNTTPMILREDLKKC